MKQQGMFPSFTQCRMSTVAEARLAQASSFAWADTATPAMGTRAANTMPAGSFVKLAPEMNSSVDSSGIMDLGCVKRGHHDHVLILTDIEALMSSAAMGLPDTASR